MMLTLLFEGAFPNSFSCMGTTANCKIRTSSSKFLYSLAPAIQNKEIECDGRGRRRHIQVKFQWFFSPAIIAGVVPCLKSLAQRLHKKKKKSPESCSWAQG